MSGGAFHDQTVLNPTNKFETEANIFAAHLLISDEDVLNNINDQVCDYEIAGKLGVDINLLSLKIPELAKMGKFNKPINVNTPQEIFSKTIALNMMISIRRLYGNFIAGYILLILSGVVFYYTHLYLLCKNLSIFD